MEVPEEMNIYKLLGQSVCKKCCGRASQLSRVDQMQEVGNSRPVIPFKNVVVPAVFHPNCLSVPIRWQVCFQKQLQEKAAAGCILKTCSGYVTASWQNI